MEMRLIGKHMKVTPRMRQHVEDKLEKLGKFNKQIIQAQVVLKTEKYLHVAEVTLLGKDLRFYGEGRSDENLFAAFDEAETKVAVQVKKRKERVKEHKLPSRREVAEIAAIQSYMENRREEEGERPVPKSSSKQVVRERSASLKPMSVEEAQMRFSSEERPVFVFRDAETHGVSVLYRRNDGKYGLIESES